MVKQFQFETFSDGQIILNVKKKKKNGLEMSVRDSEIESETNKQTTKQTKWSSKNG